jgi:protein-tyrosine phosphatase
VHGPLSGAASAGSRDNQPISGYVDIHTHLLPGIDDGSPDLEHSLAMARAAAESGIDTMAVTPHLRPDFPGVHEDELAARCGHLRAELEREGIPLRLVTGAEVSLTWALEADDEQLLLASYGQHGTDLLVETPSGHVAALDRFLYHLRARGYRVTLAHPERNLQFQREPGPLRALVEQGVLLQLNADSLLGSPFGRGTKRLARGLLRHGLAHVIASDGHRADRWRPVTQLAEAVHEAADLVGRDRAEWMAAAVPRAVTEGAELPSAPPIAEERGRRRLFGFR